VPVFAVGTERDHVAPWRSAYKINYQVDAEVTFLLASGGHNTGILAPPSGQRHSYQVKTKAADAPYIGPDEWLKAVPAVEGSWWPEWSNWLTARSSGPCEPPRMGVAHAEGDDPPDAPETSSASDLI
jgi:polyhydroxyalkanoate synthase